jgi:parvulin-like peptidyl-prolyl isomerase
LALIAYGYYTDRVLPPRENVLRVGDRHFNYAYLERRIKSDVVQGVFDTRDVQTGISQSVAGVQREELTRIIARERGVTASGEEIDAEIASELGIGGDVDHDTIAASLRQELLRLNLPLDDYLETIEYQVLLSKIEAEIAATLPAQAEQVNLRMIVGGTQSNTIIAKQALDSGSSFDEVAQKHSQDASASQGGAFGWVPRESLEPEVADIAFSITGRSEIIETEENFYILEVLGKEVRDVTEQTRADVGDQGFRDLLEEAFKSTAFAYNLSQEQLIRLSQAVTEVAAGG